MEKELSALLGNFVTSRVGSIELTVRASVAGKEKWDENNLLYEKIKQQLTNESQKKQFRSYADSCADFNALIIEAAYRTGLNDGLFLREHLFDIERT